MTIKHLYLTASYRKDLEQVVALRRSLRECGDATPHHVVVHTEDFFLFEAALADDPQVRLARTSDVLPARYERYRYDSVQRRRPSKFVRSIMKRIGMRGRVAAAGMTGWHYQQLTKMHAAASMPEECVVILDSDLIALRPPDPARLVIDGRCVLFETDGAHADSHYYGEWLDATRRFLGVRDAGSADKNYVFGPVVWSRTVVRALIAKLERDHGKPVAQIFADNQLQSEYFLYGLFARTEPAMAEHCRPTAEVLSVEIKSAVRDEDLPSLVDSLRDTRSHPFLWVHGFVPERDALVRRLRDALHLQVSTSS